MDINYYSGGEIMSDTTVNEKSKNSAGDEKLKASAIAWYAIGMSTGRQFITALVATYILIFFTDTFGIPAAAAGTIMFLATIWDAVNDPLMGTLADRTRTRWGRYRPYLVLIPLPLAVVSTLLFAAPSFSAGGKIAYAAVLYVCYGMLVTAIEIPYYALLPAMTRKSGERTLAVQLSMFVASITILVTTSFVPNLVSFFGQGNDAGGYMTITLLAGLVMIFTSLAAFLSCKEKYFEEEKKSTLSEDIRELLKHKELLSLMIIWAMGCLGFNIMMASSVYYCLYYLARPDLIPTYMLTISIGGMFGIMGLVGLFLKIFKGNVKQSFIVSQLVTAGCYVLLFFTGGKNMILLYAATFIASLFSTMSNAFIPLLVVEMTDYLAYKTGRNLNATVAAMKGFSYKCGTALTGGILGGILAVTGYIPGAVGAQPPEAMFGINASRFLVPIAAAIILCLCFIPYPVTAEVKAKLYAKNEPPQGKRGPLV
jgi:sugar (glycoside-pentoside-hexuronide) transporter